MNDMSIFSCNITYKKIKGDSEKSTYNNLVAHGFIDESYEILNDDFYKANRELNLLASDKLGKDVNLYQVKNNVAIPNTEVFKEIDLINQKPIVNNQEGIDFVFEQNPELANIGTKEQYAEYIKTIFPESKLQNIVYHGTRKNSVNTNNYFKKLEGNKKDFGIYFADYSNHYVIKNEDNSYTQSIPIIVNIKNPKLINNEIEEGLSGAVLIDNNSFSVKKYYNITNQDGILEFGSYGNKNERISNEEFFNNLDKKNEEDYKIINNIFNNNIPSSMSKIIEKLNKKNNLNNLRVKEGLVFDPEQIYILGNEKDQEMFSNFVKNQFLPIEESNFDINIPCVINSKI